MPEARRLPAQRRQRIAISFDETPLEAYPGETLATALMAAGVHAFRHTRTGAPRMPFCNMGGCFDCAVTVDGVPLIRACLAPVRDGMVVTRGQNA